MHALLDYIRREAQNAIAMREAKGTLLCTGYNPQTHAVKGILMPQQVETGWIPISVAHAGNNFGILVGPKVGDPSKAADGFDGDVFDVEFDGGDVNTPVAKLKQFSSQNQPPQVQSGEILFKDTNGNNVYFKQDKSLTVQHETGGVFQFDKNGNANVSTANGMNITVNAGQGSITYTGQSHTFNGNTTMQGNLTASGTVTGSNITDSSDGKSV